MISRIRRNHGLEHATLHALSKRFPHRNIAGYSDPFGFWIVGDLPTETVAEVVLEALGRMKAGEKNLAVHPYCGTNFLTTGTLAGMAGALAMLGAGKRWRDKLERLPLAVGLATLAVILSQPLGFLLQSRITTSGEPGDLQVAEIHRQQQGCFTAHRVLTRG